MTRNIIATFVAVFYLIPVLFSQPLSHKTQFTRQDTLRGSNTPERSWWDVLHYDISITPDNATKSIIGNTTIQYKIVAEKHSDYLQIDLQQPLKLDEIFYNNKPYINYPPKPYYRDGNAWFIPLPKAPLHSIQSITIKYHGTPVEAVQPPWNGGWIWTRDANGRPWISVTSEGIGASCWYPCKDYLGDEPDNGAMLTINVPDTTIAVGNGRLISKTVAGHTASYQWQVKNPINNYNIAPYIGKYTTWSDTLIGEKGKLDLSFWVLENDVEKARKQFAQVKQMLRAFEYWFGPYPFYEDGYKLVEAPYLGMEHQSGIAYGNQFVNGYNGKDLSNSGWGMKWDYIIVHESGHEWFGNSITSKDIADMWVHEAFATYSETLFIEYYYGKEAANEYTLGMRTGILNDKPVIGIYGVNQEGSTDMYSKGSNIIHTIRQVINDDKKFRKILIGLNLDFYHQTVTTKQIEQYFTSQSGIDLEKIFDQYLRTTNVPTLQIKTIGNKTNYRWHNTVPGFNMPVMLNNGTWLRPTSEWKEIQLNSKDMEVNKNFYISTEKL